MSAMGVPLGPIVQVEAGELSVGLADLGPADVTHRVAGGPPGYFLGRNSAV